MTTDQELINEAQVRQDADAELQSNIDDESSARQAADAAEAALREAADLAEASARQAAIDAEVLARQAAIDAEVLARNAAISVAVTAEQQARELFDGMLDAKIDQEILDRQAADTQLSDTISSTATSLMGTIGAVNDRALEAELALDGKIEAEKSRIDAILSASDADKDSFAEIVTLINSVDTTNDQAFAGYVSSNDARVSEVESDLAQESSDRQSADQSLQSAIDSHLNDAADAHDASAISFDNSGTDVVATNVQGAIVEVGTVLTQELEAEVSRAMGVESSLQSQIDSEETRAMGIEAQLQSDLDDLDGYAQDIRSDLDDLDGYAQDIRSDVDDLESSISSESSARQLADQGLQSQINTEKSRIDAMLSAADEDKNSFAEISSLIESTSSSLQSSISSESSARQLADQGLQSQIDTEKSRIDAMLSASEADKDSFAEIVTLINSIDTTNSEGFASYVISNNARVSEVESDLSQEALDRQSGDSALDERIVPMEEILEFEKAIVYENNSAVYADSQPGIEDASLRPGWYYKNSVAGQKINWYFFDGVNQANVSLGDLSAYAVMTFDSVSPVKSPIMAVYTMPTGTNDIMPGFAHSRVVYSGLSITPSAGKKYLVYFGQNPAIHPELPRIQLSMSTSNSVGEKNPSERVLTTSFGSNSSDGVNTVQFMVEALGVISSSFKGEVELKIRGASLKKLEDITSRLAAIEDNGFSNGNVTVGAELGYVDLDRQYSKLMSVSIGRLAIHEGEDFTVSVVDGKTRLTWINSLAVGGDQAIQTGDRVFFVGAY
jgi:hypothetical protein